MEGKDTRSKQHMRQNKKHHELKPGGAIQGIIESDLESDSNNSSVSRCPIESNWSRYEEEEPSEEDRFAEDQGLLDIEMLVKQPISTGSFFRFKSEESWEKTEVLGLSDDPIVKKCKEYFEINVNVLSAALETIPFYKRVDLDKSLFSAGDIHRMDAAAEMAEHKYKILLKEYGDKKICGNQQSSSQETELKIPQISEEHNKTGEDKELDELLNMTSNVENLKMKDNVDVTSDNKAQEDRTTTDYKNMAADEARPTTNPENKEDIQQWLDAILGE